MRLYVHFCNVGFTNCYILGNDSPTGNNDALIIDPGTMDEKILNNIEENEYDLKGVLITHGDSNHIRGLRTLRKIYNVEIFSINPIVREEKTIVVRDGETISIGSFSIEIIAVAGHSTDSAIFKIEKLLFTGDALSAGLVGRTANIYGEANQMTALQSKILSLPGDYTILPGHGPPTTLEAERLFNADINSFDERMRNRRSSNMEIQVW